MNIQIEVIAHNIRSTHNVGSLFRTCDGLGVKKLYLSGYTPYPLSENENRLPHIAKRANDQIAKTSLGAEKSLSWERVNDTKKLIKELKQSEFTVVGLEQNSRSQNLADFSPPEKIVLLLGEEINGISPELLKLCDKLIEIPMLGKKESFNVTIAAAIALYQIRFSKYDY